MQYNKTSNSDVNILIVDDEPDIIEFLTYNLKQEGYHILHANDGLEAVLMAREHKPHLIILDLMMPHKNGIEACAEIREIKELNHTLICFLTARNEDYSQIAGLEAGADDYIAKPINLKVLKSRIKALLRRKEVNESSDTIIEHGYIHLNRNTYKVHKGADEFSIPRKEFELLALLMSKPGHVFKRDYILDTVWGGDVIVGERTIDVHIRKLREKLGDEIIKTIKGVGYKFEVN